VVVVSVLERVATRPTFATLDEHRRELTRRVLSIICRTTGRRRTPDECADLDALVRDIHQVRNDLRNARIDR
jgi:hypothetical protein